MDNLLSSKSLLPGFRFSPTDEELFMFYLKRKILGKSLSPQMISEVDIYRFEPWDLPSKSFPKFKDLNWYFFCPRSKKYANGARANRSTEHGYWKSTGNDRTVQYRGRPVGKIKTLIFHVGKPPRGDRTDWVMHEYRLEDKLLADQGVPQDAYVICKVYKKSGVGPKNGEHHGAPFVEEEWESDPDDGNVDMNSELVSHHEACGVSVADDLNGSTVSIPSTELAAVETPPLPPIETEDELERLLANFIEDETPINGVNDNADADIFSGLEDLHEGFRSSRVNSDGLQYLPEDGDCYMELNDLI